MQLSKAKSTETALTGVQSSEGFFVGECLIHLQVRLLLCRVVLDHFPLTLTALLVELCVCVCVCVWRV